MADRAKKSEFQRATNLPKRETQDTEILSPEAEQSWSRAGNGDCGWSPGKGLTTK